MAKLLQFVYKNNFNRTYLGTGKGVGRSLIFREGRDT
jgi:hypothetical protein